jgi:riboflavin synthase
MFTGIIEEAGTVLSAGEGRQAIELVIESKICSKSLKVGDSVAVNGCCLTVAAVSGPRKTMLRFDLLRETWKLTNLQFADKGVLVNLERPLRADGRLDGHFVTGHIDGIGNIIRWEQSGKDWVLEVLAPEEVMRYLVSKGSIAVDGISLTVAEVRKKSFVCWIIPHTREVTALRQRAVGSTVNLEADIIGKYVEKFAGLRK